MALYRFSDLPKPVDIAVPAEMLQVLVDLLPGWQIEPWAGADRESVLRLAHGGREYSITGPWVPNPIHRSDPVDAACGFIAELIRAYVNEVTERLCLHAAGVEIGGRLVIFPSTHKAGKSILSAALAAAGCRLSGDDIVLIDASNGIGVAGGVCPRLRLPLPANLRPETTSFIAANSGPTGKRYSYLTLDEGALARKEERMPIGTFVLLERTDKGAPRLDEIEQADALKTVIWQNFARREPSTLILERLYALVRHTGAFRLTYSRAEDAVEHLQACFGSWPDNHFVAADAEDELPIAAAAGRSAPAPVASAPGLRRRADVAAIEIDGKHFLADNESGRITLLNETAAAVWNALGGSMTEREIVDLMAIAFPEVDVATIAGDVRSSLMTLVDAGLVIPPEN